LRGGTGVKGAGQENRRAPYIARIVTELSRGSQIRGSSFSPGSNREVEGVVSSKELKGGGGGLGQLSPY